MKKVFNLLFCMLQIECSSFLFLLSFFAFIDVRDNCIIYHTELIPALFHEIRFFFSFLLALLFAFTSWITLSFFSKNREKEGRTLSQKQKCAIILFSILIPPAVLLIIIVSALFFSPLEPHFLKILFWISYLAIFALINYFISIKLHKQFEKRTD